MLSVVKLQPDYVGTINIDSKTTTLVSKPLGEDKTNLYAAQTVGVGFKRRN